MSKSSTTIENEWLDEIHPGDLVRSEFVEGNGLSPEEVAEAIMVEPEALRDFLAGKTGVDAHLDLRLGRYFGVSPGFFLRLQIGYDIRVWKRAHGADLDRIVPRPPESRAA